MAPTIRGITRRNVGSVNATEKLMKRDLAADGIESITDSFPTLLLSSVISVGRSLPIPPAFLLCHWPPYKMAKVELRAYSE
jgi:hypothetical protein